MKQMVKGWEVKDNKLYRELKFKDFKEALFFINEVGGLAEKLNHHPSISNSYNIVKLSLWTHSENKITEKDYKFANQINKIL